MSDFLGRMAGRALGTLPVAQPVIPSTFAPEGAAAERAVGENAALRAPSALPLEGSVQPAPRDTMPERQAEHTLEPQGRDDALATPPIVREKVPNATIVVEPTRPGPDPPVLKPLIREAPASFPNPDSPTTLPLPAREKRPVAASRIAPAREPSPRLSAQPSAETAGPVIRVTIGRVDVRAEFSAPNTRSAPVRRQAPTLSLDEYMKQRSEGKR